MIERYTYSFARPTAWATLTAAAPSCHGSSSGWPPLGVSELPDPRSSNHASTSCCGATRIAPLSSHVGFSRPVPEDLGARSSLPQRSRNEPKPWRIAYWLKHQAYRLCSLAVLWARLDLPAEATE